jgi:hypothetical protein
MSSRVNSLLRQHGRAANIALQCSAVLLLLHFVAPAGAQAPGVSSVRTRGAGVELRAAETNGCVQRQLEVRAFESAQRVRPGDTSPEQRGLRVTYGIKDLCLRRTIAFVIEASEAISLMIRPQLDQADLLVEAPSIRVKRCAVVGASAVCEAVDMPVRLHAHWTYNGLYEIQIGRTRTRDASGFQSDATNQVLHMATVDYEFELNGEAIPIAGVSGSIGWSSEAQMTFTTPAGVPVTALP